MTDVIDRLQFVDANDTEAVKALKYPRFTIDGKAYDAAVGRTAGDPFVSSCPSWCDEAETGHRHVLGCDEDRTHYGLPIDVVVRSIRCDYESGLPNEEEDDRYVLGSMRLYLQQRVLEQAPTVYLGECEKAGYHFTPAEAREIARVLVALAEQAEAAFLLELDLADKAERP